jgi:hypothetical protein
MDCRKLRCANGEIIGSLEPVDVKPIHQTGQSQPVTLEQESITTEHSNELADAAKQEEYRQAFLLQQRRRSCPGCGDTEIL